MHISLQVVFHDEHVEFAQNVKFIIVGSNLLQGNIVRQINSSSLYVLIDTEIDGELNPPPSRLQHNNAHMYAHISTPTPPYTTYSYVHMHTCMCATHTHVYNTLYLLNYT